jgi:hypothetical protein
MKLEEMDKKVLALIEELNPDSENLTDDPDIVTKKRYVTNQVMFDLVRLKKLPRYVEIAVNEGDLITFDDIERECGNEVYQLCTVSGVAYEFKADGTVIKVRESGTLEVECYVFPERITADTNGSYEFELAPDVLEIMPYGIAADLLKSDVSTEYGAIYANRYETMLQRLDPRNNMASIYIEGGVL